MSSPFVSPDRLERRDALRREIRRGLAEKGLDDIDLGRLLGYSQQRFAKLLAWGEVQSIALADLALVVKKLGPGVLEALASACGFRLVPDLKAGFSTGGPGVLVAAGAVMREAGEVATRAAQAVTSGITPNDAAELTRDLNAVRRALNALEAAVSVAVVEPPSDISDARSSRR